MVFTTRRFILSIALTFVPVCFFSPFSIVITSLGEDRAGLCASRAHGFVYFARVDFCPSSLPLGVGVGCGL